MRGRKRLQANPKLARRRGRIDADGARVIRKATGPVARDQGGGGAGVCHLEHDLVGAKSQSKQNVRRQRRPNLQ